MGGNTLEVASHQGEIIASELKLLLAGKNPKYILNAATLSSFTWTGPRETDDAALKERSQSPGPGATDLEITAQNQKMGEQTARNQERQPACSRTSRNFS